MTTRKSLIVPSTSFIVAGAFLLVGFATYFIDNPVQNWNWWTYFISDAALVVGASTLTSAVRGAARWLLFLSALGFLLVCVWVVASLPEPFLTIGTVVGAGGLLVAAAVSLHRRALAGSTAIALIVAMALLLVNYFAQVPVAPAFVISILEALVLVAAAILMVRARR